MDLSLTWVEISIDVSTRGDAHAEAENALVNVAGGDSLRELWLDAKLSAMVNVHSASALVFVRRSDGNVCNLQIVYKLHTQQKSHPLHIIIILSARQGQNNWFLRSHSKDVGESGMMSCCGRTRIKSKLRVGFLFSSRRRPPHYHDAARA
jgi:hypothetical protein